VTHDALVRVYPRCHTLDAVLRLPPRARAMVVLPASTARGSHPGGDRLMVPHELETRLTDDHRQAANGAALRAPTLDAVRADAARRTRRHRLRVALLATAAAVVVAAGAAGLLARSGADRDRTDIGRTPATTPVPTTEPTAPTTRPSVTATPPSSVPAASAAPATPTSPEVEGFDLRADGIGQFDFGASPNDVLTDAIAELGQPVHDDVLTDLPGPCTRRPGTAGPAIDPAWRAARVVTWRELSLDFVGPDPSSLRLVGWYTLIMPDAARRPRMSGGGPTIGDPLTAWQAAYGSLLEPNGPTAAVHLPAGDVLVNVDGPGQSAEAGAHCDDRDV
jgi:hypothetical protein